MGRLIAIKTFEVVVVAFIMSFDVFVLTSARHLEIVDK